MTDTHEIIIAALFLGFAAGWWAALTVVWARQLRRLNPEMPTWVRWTLAFAWPYCEFRAD